MNIDDLKFIVGEAKKDRPAIIRFFGPVNSESVYQFNQEFLYLQDYICPSKIVVSINSEGGSVMHGMSTFTIIQSCPIEVDCVIEGIAASMGSVIWAAGDNLFMHDYSILMIHNPFAYGSDDEDEDYKNMINAFKIQLETIYKKRFGMPVDKVRKIMDGEGNADGTYFNAKDAVSAGILPAANILKTSQQIRNDVKNQIEGITNMESLRSIMASIAKKSDESKLIEKINTIHIQNKHEFQEQKVMDKENMNFSAVCAQLGFSNDVPVANVSNRVAELLKAEVELTDVKSQLNELQIKYQGKEAEVKNLSEKLNDTQSELQKYQEAEKAALQAEIEGFVQNAVDAGKIDAEAKQSWIDMAQSNFDVVKATLNSIQGREKISEVIAQDPENHKDAQDAVKTAEEKMAEQVEAVVGKVELKSFN